MLDPLLHHRDFDDELAELGGVTGAFGGLEDLDANVDFDPHTSRDISPLIDTWIPLSNALNDLHRTMGQPDLNRLSFSPPVIQKLAAIHNLVHGRKS